MVNHLGGDDGSSAYDAALSSGVSEESSGSELFGLTGVPLAAIQTVAVAFVLCLMVTSMISGIIVQIIRRRCCVKQYGPTGYETIQTNIPANLANYTG